MHIAFFSSYVPRKCGIATYTRDLTEELIRQGHKVRVIAMEHAIEPVLYPSNVLFTIKEGNLSDYKKAADKLNRTDVDFVHIQHEFGLFGGQDGEYILTFARLIKKPLITTFHTILLEPSLQQKTIIQELTRLSRSVIVMETIAQDRLQNVYALNPQDIQVIFHGVPNIDDMKKEESKKYLGLSGSFVVMASNLISRNKGLEYVIGDFPSVIEKIPEAKLLIVGETHPVVREEEGETYREELQELVKKLKIQERVQFINRYLTLDELKVFYSASDICITPYLDSQQITSGTLSYAIGAGKACISTPYIYAQNMLSKGAGMFVPFRNGKSIASAIVLLYKNPLMLRTMEKKAYRLGKEMRWPSIAKKHTILYKELQNRFALLSKQVASFIQKSPNLSYLEFLTDHVGILQHAHHIIPETRFGYSTDDNARALVVISELFRRKKSAKLLKLMKTYLTFLRLAQEPNGRFHTFLNFQRKWIDDGAVSDPYGKAIFSLGYNMFVCKKSPFFDSIDSMFKISMQHIDVIQDLRTAAYTILGLFYYVKAFEGEKDTAAFALVSIRKLADFLLQRYERFRDGKWYWFEEKITYDNFRLPQALFAAYLVTNDSRYKDIAIQTLEFITTCNIDFENGYFDFIGQNGWYEKNKTKSLYDQQPLEASGAAEAFLFAYVGTKKKKYLDLALLAFEWFFGRNRNQSSLYDEKMEGVFDGLTPSGVNMNEGAESLVCFLIAHLSLQNVLKKE